MRKPLVAFGLVVCTSLGSFPIADAAAATLPGSTLSSSQQSPTNSSASAARPTNAVSGAQIVALAMRYIGYPYTATGNSPSTGFSCIGFVSFVYRSLGIPLPGDLGGAMSYAPQVPFSDLLPGDILYFQNTVWNGLSHAAIYIGGGKFVHAEWYGKGVRVTSFNNDPSDGDYWIGHYLGANRPWTGPAIASVVPSVPSKTAPQAPNVPGTTATSIVPPNATSTVVVVSALNVRSGHSMQSTVQQVIRQGTTVYVLGKSGGWYKVQLPDGTVGWVVAAGISVGAGQISTTTTTSSSQTSTSQSNVGTVTAPARIKQPAKRPQTTASVSVSALNVHSAPSLNASVVSSASSGQHLVVLGRKGNWIKVRLPDGTVGWISASYARVHGKKTSTASTSAASTIASSAASKTFSGSTATVAMNVRSGRSLHSSIVTVVPVGGKYQILGWTNGWARVRLPNGTVGWISGTVLGVTTKPTTYSSSTYSRTPKKSSSTVRKSAGRSVITAGVRVHSSPGINAPVVGLAAAGTHVTILGYRSGWALVRLPSGHTGYVLGTYVRA